MARLHLARTFGPEKCPVSDRPALRPNAMAAANCADRVPACAVTMFPQCVIDYALSTTEAEGQLKPEDIGKVPAYARTAFCPPSAIVVCRKMEAAHADNGTVTCRTTPRLADLEICRFTSPHAPAGVPALGGPNAKAQQ
jgi:hypothetical protein